MKNSFSLWFALGVLVGGQTLAGEDAFSSPPAVATPTATVTDSDPRLALLNANQRAVLVWTDRQFRSLLDARTFAGWPEKERADLETRQIDALKGPRTQEYYQAINTLAALRSTNALPALRGIAFERADRNNRDRWMAIRALGLIGDKAAVPELIHLVYHGNQNTHWWAQITLVRLTGQNFGGDWSAWGKWWNESGGQPAYKPEIIRWWNGQPEPDKLAESLAEGDRSFLARLDPVAPISPSSPEMAKRLGEAVPLMQTIREQWAAINLAVNQQDATNALASLKAIAPQIEGFRARMKGTVLEADMDSTLTQLLTLRTALEKGDLATAQTLMRALGELGGRIEQRIKAITEATATR